MNLSFCQEFGILFVAALVGGAAILPYSFELLKMSSKTKPLRMPINKLMWLAFLQTMVLSAVIVILGLLVAKPLGHSALTLNHAGLHLGLFVGILTGLFFLVFDFSLLSYLPKPLIDSTRNTTIFQNFAAAFYGGINEELLTRWFGLSAIVWLLAKLWPSAQASSGIFWIANIIIAILFGLGHLPTTKSLVGRITPFLLFRALLLNGIIGLACGYLFWNYGIVAAMIAHFSADIVYHVGGTAVIKYKD